MKMIEREEKKKRIPAKTVGLDLLVVLALVLLLFIPRVSTLVRVEGDDTNSVLWREMETRLPEFLSHHYHNASGRITAKALEWVSGSMSLSGWKILETCAMCLFSVTLYGFAAWIGIRNRIVRILFAGLLPFLMNSMILYEAHLWITGSCNYSLVLIPGLLGAILFAQARLPGSKTGKEGWRIAVGTAGMLFSAMGNEQIASVLFALLLILFFVRAKGKQPVVAEGIAGALVLAVLLINYVFCPGTEVRIERELAWIPDFYTVPVTLHIRYAWQWLCMACTNNLGTLPLVLFILEGIALWKQKKDRLRIPAVAAFVFGGLYGFGKAFGHTLFINPGWGILPEGGLQLFLLLFWTAGILFSLLILFFCFSEKHKTWAAVLLLAAGYASIAMMTLSPTMIASSVRTQYVCSVLMMLVIGMLLAQIRSYSFSPVSNS